MRIENIEKWNEVSVKLSARGYSLYQMQYAIDLPEGFHATFFSKESPLVEIVTYNNAVYDAILRYTLDGQ
ncbi:hypothetical protein SDC9_168927 [bioreactor metagenome]|uniref:Uncharacterized protein n=1 Tax=bioreactor metagenome TaxID=1076179 RepID=A0A645G3S3_9ZZZZ